MICPECGYNNEDGSLFCDNCKTDLDSPVIAPLTRSTPMNDDQLPPAEPVDIPITLSEAVPAESIPPVLLEPTTEILEPIVPAVPFNAENVPAIPYSALSTVVPPPPEPVSVTPPIPVVPPPATASVLKPRLVVMRGMKVDMTYPIYPGSNFLGRTDDKPVDIDLDEQEAPDRIWCSRQHAVIHFENGKLTLEDLNSLNGSFVNRNRVYPGQPKELHENDVIQIGTVHMKLLLG